MYIVTSHFLHVKIVPDMTYNVFVGMLNLAQSNPLSSCPCIATFSDSTNENKARATILFPSRLSVYTVHPLHATFILLHAYTT